MVAGAGDAAAGAQLTCFTGSKSTHTDPAHPHQPAPDATCRMIVNATKKETNFQVMPTACCLMPDASLTAWIAFCAATFFVLILLLVMRTACCLLAL